MARLAPGVLVDGRYRLLGSLGVGGMSVVWRARDEVLERFVAVKVLNPDLAAQPRLRGLIRAEALAAARLAHPHIAAVHDYGEARLSGGGWIAYVVMELLEGESLATRLAAGPLPWRFAVEVCAEVAAGLAAAHAGGYVHRDVTPGNIMLTPAGAKMLDFGIVAPVGAPDDDGEGSTFGTPAYVAPERLDGTPAQPATDVYALGVLLYETLTGTPPYPALTWDDLDRLGRTRVPPAPVGVPGLPATVAELCARCLSADPAARPPAEEVARRLRECGGWGPRARGTGQAIAAAVPRLRLAVVLAGLAAITLLGGSLVTAVAGGLVPGQGGGHDPAGAAGAAGPAGPAGASPRVPTPGETASPGRSSAPGTRVPPGTTVPPGATVPPGPGGSPGTRPEPGPAVPAEPSGPATAAATLAGVSDLITAGAAGAQIRDDVALDLRQLIDNLRADLARRPVDLPAVVADLRAKVATRTAEGAITASMARRLDGALAAVPTT